jgi:predicted ATPase
MLAQVGTPSERRVCVGRERELVELSSALAAARRGRGSLCLLVGERGIGKTTLAEQLCEAAGEQGIQVVRGPCRDARGAPAYWPWIQVLRALARERPQDERPQ